MAPFLTSNGTSMNLWLLTTSESSNAVIKTTFIRKDETIVISQAFQFAAVGCYTEHEPEIDLYKKFQALGDEHNWEVKNLANNFFSSWEYDGTDVILSEDIERLLSQGLGEVEHNGWSIYDQELWLNSPLELRYIDTIED